MACFRCKDLGIWVYAGHLKSPFELVHDSIVSKTVVKLLAYTKTLHSGLECSVSSLTKEEGVEKKNVFMVIMASAFLFTMRQPITKERGSECCIFNRLNLKCESWARFYCLQ